MTATATGLDLNAYNETKNAVSKNPSAGEGQFESLTTWSNGAMGVTRARSFEIRTDEPEALGGKDSAIDPMELLLGALGSCLTIGWATHAEKRGVNLYALQIRVTAPFDLRGYLGVSRDVRPGFSELRYEVSVDSDADPATLEEIKIAAEEGSPMLDNILNATPTKGVIQSGVEA